MSETDREHAVAVPAYPGDLAALATEVGRLRYDALAHFLDELASELGRQAIGDRARGRVKLAARLDRLSSTVAEAASQTGAAWQLCRPHVAHELGKTPEVDRNGS